MFSNIMLGILKNKINIRIFRDNITYHHAHAMQQMGISTRHRVGHVESRILIGLEAKPSVSIRVREAL